MVEPQESHDGSYFGIGKFVLLDLRYILVSDVAMENIFFDNIGLASIPRGPTFHSFS